MAADAEKLRAQAERIKELRKAKERRDGKTLSQETAAHDIGVSSRTYRTWEGSGAVLKLENLKALATYYDTTTDYIECGERQMTETPDLSMQNDDEQLDRIERKLDRVLDLLTPPSEAEPERVVGGIADRLEEIAESPPTTVPAPPVKPPVKRRRKSA